MVWYADMLRGDLFVIYCLFGVDVVLPSSTEATKYGWVFVFAYMEAVFTLPWT